MTSKYKPLEFCRKSLALIADDLGLWVVLWNWYFSVNRKREREIASQMSV